MNDASAAAAVAAIGGQVAAVDFGGTNVDILICHDGELTRRFVPAGPAPTPGLLHSLLLASGADDPAALRWIAVTGGRHRALPDALDSTPLIKVEELRAIGRGGLVASGETEALMASVGTGTAFVGAREGVMQHYGGSGVGGGTVLGLCRLLLGTTDAAVIDTLASRGDTTRIDLTVGDIVGGPVGRIPAHATAAHFGKAAGVVEGTWVGAEEQPGREDVAAAVMNLVGQTAVRLAHLCAVANGYQRVVLLGHLADLASFRRGAGEIGGLFGGMIVVPPHPGFAVALGALLEAAEAGR